MSVFKEKNGIFEGAKPCAIRLEPVAFQPDPRLCVTPPKRKIHAVKHTLTRIPPGMFLIFGIIPFNLTTLFAFKKGGSNDYLR